jgi:hypothetical protein
MTALLALVSSELRQRRLLLAASALLGLLAVAAPLLPSLPAGSPGEVRAATALLIVAVWAPLLALLAGATALAGEMADRRLGFYLARPLATWKIWAGKMAAAALLPLLAGALVVLPAALTGAPFAMFLEGAFDDRSVLAPGIAVAAVIALVAFAHAAAIVLRSRRAWLLLDLVALAVGAALVVEAVRILRHALVPQAVLFGAIRLSALTVVALLGAGALAVHRGRGDLAAAHRTLSLALWPPLLAGALGFLLLAGWVVGAPIDSVKSPRVWAPRGRASWVIVGGEAAHRFGFRPLFLFHTATGRSVRIGRESFSWPAFAADGSRAVWLAQPEERSQEVWGLDLTRADAQPRRTPITLAGWPQWMELSPRGERLAFLQRDRLLLYGIADGRLLAAVRLAPSNERELHFLDEDRVRLIEKQVRPKAAHVAVSDLAIGGHLERRGQFDAPKGAGWKVSPQGNRLLVWAGPTTPGGPATVRLHALPGGELLTSLPRRPRAEGDFLADGRIVLSERREQGQEVRTLSGDGREERSWRFPGINPLWLGGQPSPHSLVVGARIEDGWAAYRLDLRTGSMAELGRDLSPVADPETSGPAARLFTTADGAVVEVADDGTRRAVLPRRD